MSRLKLFPSNPDFSTCRFERNNCVSDCLWEYNFLCEDFLFLVDLFAAVDVVTKARKVNLEDIEFCHYFVDFLAPGHSQTVLAFVLGV